jgi:hypothetical protein
MGHAFVPLGKLAPLCVVTGRVEQVDHQCIAALVAHKAALEPQRSPLGTERRVVALTSLSFVRQSAIDMRLTQALELDLMSPIPLGLFGSGRLAALPVVDASRPLRLTLQLLRAVSFAVMVAHGTAFLGAKAHQTSGAVFCRGTATSEGALVHAPFGFCLQSLTRLELLAASADAA